MAIMTGTRFDPAKRYHNASGDVAADLLVPGSGILSIYIRRGLKTFSIGQYITYSKDDVVITGPIQSIDDLAGQSFLVYNIAYTGGAITSNITGGTVYEGSADSFLSGGIPADSLTTISGNSITSSSVIKYAPFIIIGLVVIGAVIWRLKKK